MHLREFRANLYLSMTLGTALHMAEAPDVPALDDLVPGIEALEDLEPSVQALEDLEPGVEALEDLEAALAVSSGHDVVLDDVVSACPTGEMLRFSLLEARIERRLPVQPERCLLALGFSFAVVPI